ncbi:MAG: YcxB family protein [Clostridia bacterium]|nr:YcxB family protein [Clostridia bacterium]
MEPASAAVQEWPIDLKKEEFVHCQRLLARMHGPLRKRTVLWAVSFLSAAMFFATCLLDTARGATPDWSLVFSGLLLGLSVFVCWYTPYRMRHQAARQYEQSVACGQDYYGRLRVYPTRIEKVGDFASVSLALDETTFFVEEKDMMVFAGRSRFVLALPARCMTAEMATAVRQAADRLPVRNRRFFSRLQPKGLPAEKPAVEKAQPLWQQKIRFNAEEFVTITRAQIIRRYWKIAPWLAALSVLGGFAFGWNGEAVWPCVAWFLLCFGAITLLNLGLPLARAKGLRSLSVETLPSMDISVDARGVHIAAENGRVGVPWSAVQHVYDRDAFVEICNKHGAWYIPKRCIEDFTAFSAVIDHCRGKQ